MARSTLDRRRLLVTLGGAAAAGIASEMTGAPSATAGRGGGGGRAERAYRMRVEAAETERKGAAVLMASNGDEDRYPSRFACYSKGLPHDSQGVVDPKAYDALVRAISGADAPAMEHLTLGGARKLENPLAAFAYDLEGPDPQRLAVPAAPAFASAELAAEAAELYWQALTRDVPFAEYDTDPLTIAAAADLSRFSGLRAPKKDGKVTPATLFRGSSAREIEGPYVSQFLMKNVPQGALLVLQQFRSLVPAQDYLTSPQEWLAVQNGVVAREARPDPNPRYIRSGRDLAEYVHQDFTYQAFLNAALILLAMPAKLDYANPYRQSATQIGFVTFGGPMILDMVARVANCALKAVWYQKWCVHRRLRPEELGGRVHQTRTGNAAYPVHSELLRSPALDAVFARHRTYLLPQAYPEGAPLHPSYPAGHAVIAGACATVLKAFFDESTVILDPVTTSGDCLSLHKHRGPELTVGGELDKLGSNIAFGRNMAGIHYRSDGVEGIRLGETVALGVLRDFRGCYHEKFQGFSVTLFDGSTVTV